MDFKCDAFRSRTCCCVVANYIIKNCRPQLFLLGLEALKNDERKA